MIDFRYHLVSIVAIFLALAIGIVIGTTALNGPITSGLQKETANLSNQLASERIENGTLTQQVEAAGTFAQTAVPKLLAHLLDGQRVVVIDAPGSSGQVEQGVAAMLAQAGATISGQVQLQSMFFTTSESTLNVMDTVSQTTKPADLTLTGSTPQQRAAQVLASAVVTKKEPGVQDATSQAILSSFAGPGFLTTSGQPAARATLAVVITPADPLTGPDAATTNQSLTEIAVALNSASLAAVVAGPQSSTQAGGTIAALRGSDSANQVSSVDDADQTFGQIVVAQVLAEQMSTRTPGSYGTGPGATQIGPSPMPSAHAAGSASPSPTPAKRAMAGTPR